MAINHKVRVCYSRHQITVCPSPQEWQGWNVPSYMVLTITLPDVAEAVLVFDWLFQLSPRQHKGLWTHGRAIVESLPPDTFYDVTQTEPKGEKQSSLSACSNLQFFTGVPCPVFQKQRTTNTMVAEQNKRQKLSLPQSAGKGRMEAVSAECSRLQREKSQSVGCSLQPAGSVQ